MIFFGGWVVSVEGYREVYGFGLRGVQGLV